MYGYSSHVQTSNKHRELIVIGVTNILVCSSFSHGK